MAIVLVAADLRPAVVAVALVLSEIQATELLSATAGGSSPRWSSPRWTRCRPRVGTTPGRSAP